MTIVTEDVDQPDLLTHREVARLCRVKPETVDAWVKAGKLDPGRTPGGHRRYRRADVEELLMARASRDTRAGSWA